MEVFQLSDFISYRDDAFTRIPLFRTERCAMFMLNLLSGQAVAPHTHPSKHVILRTIAGKATITCGTAVKELSGEQMIWIHGDETVAIANHGPAPLNLNVIVHD